MASFLKQSKVNFNPELYDDFLVRRDLRTILKRFSGIIQLSFPYLICILSITSFFYYEFLGCFTLLTVILTLLINNKKFDFPFEAPEWTTKIEKESVKKTLEKNRIFRKRKSGIGTLIYGVEYILRRLLVISADMETRHTLVLGSTGSGKTVFIVCLLYQALLQPGGSSAVIVDGKADIKLFWIIFGILKRLDRLEDLLVVNCLTPMDTVDEFDAVDEKKISHTMNFLNMGTPDQMKTLTMGLKRESGGGESALWEGRTSSMISALYNYIVYERDFEGLEVDISVIRDMLPLRTLLIKAARPDVPQKNRNSLQAYLKTLPGIGDEHFQMNENEIASMEIYPRASDQHIYNLMALGEVMQEMSESMKHIFVSKLSEANCLDVCSGGRVLLYLLPSIAKNADGVAAMGRLLLTGLRPVLARAAGIQLQGTRERVHDSRLANMQYPVRLFFDEYGMYAVPGFYVLVALIRAYGFAALFGAQTAGMFKKAGGQEEFEALIGNLNNKVFFKNEDSGESLNLIIGRTGKMWIAKQDKIETTASGSIHDSEDVRVEQQDMVTSRMLASAEPGEGIFVYGKDVVPFRVFNFKYPEIDSCRLNFFSQVLKPTDDEAQSYLRRFMLSGEKNRSKIVETLNTKVEHADFSFMTSYLDEVKTKGKSLSVSRQIQVTLGLMLSNTNIEEVTSENQINLDFLNVDVDKLQEQYVNVISNEPLLSIEFAKKQTPNKLSNISQQQKSTTNFEELIEFGFSNYIGSYNDNSYINKGKIIDESYKIDSDEEDDDESTEIGIDYINKLLLNRAIASNLDWEGVENLDENVITTDKVLMNSSLDVGSEDDRSLLKKEIENILSYPKESDIKDISDSQIEDSIDSLLNAIEGKW